MAKEGGNPLNDVLQDEAGLLQSWVERQVNAPGFRSDRTSREQLTEHSRRFLSLFAEAAKTGVADIREPAWANVRTDARRRLVRPGPCRAFPRRRPPPSFSR